MNRSTYYTLHFYKRPATFKIFSGWYNGWNVSYASVDTGNVSLYHSNWIVPGTLNLND